MFWNNSGSWEEDQNVKSNGQTPIDEKSSLKHLVLMS
jgi:hypothetical protein